jgi:hypothetical protein
VCVMLLCVHLLLYRVWRLVHILRTYFAHISHLLYMRASRGEHPGVLQAAVACEEKNSSELDGRVIMVREDREDRDIKRGRKPSGRMHREGEPSGLQVRQPQYITIGCGVVWLQSLSLYCPRTQ